MNLVRNLWQSLSRLDPIDDTEAASIAQGERAGIAFASFKKTDSPSISDNETASGDKDRHNAADDLS